MILYFSGTGNSKYAAQYIASQTGDETLDLFDRIKTGNFAPVTSVKPWVLVVPTYAWQIPHIVRDWLRKAELTGSREFYFVMTCGDSIGNADKHNCALCKTKGLHYRGTAKIVMPENYIAMFNAPDAETALRIVNAAERVLKRVADTISREDDLPKEPVRFVDNLLSGMVNSAFYPMFVKAKKFYAKDTCTGCGLCEKVCPLSNVKLVGGRPVWEKHCTHCMACICKCPADAIEYGKISKGKVRYLCPKE